jgi:hypothetical protein
VYYPNPRGWDISRQYMSLIYGPGLMGQHTHTLTPLQSELPTQRSFKTGHETNESTLGDKAPHAVVAVATRTDRLENN